MLVDGYLDADGVQDVDFETTAAVKAILNLCAGVSVPDTIFDNGFVMNQDNLQPEASRMWGSRKARRL
jgi:hypothetical protein